MVRTSDLASSKLESVLGVNWIPFPHSLRPHKTGFSVYPKPDSGLLHKLEFEQTEKSLHSVSPHGSIFSTLKCFNTKSCVEQNMLSQRFTPLVVIQRQEHGEFNGNTELDGFCNYGVINLSTCL